MKNHLKNGKEINYEENKIESIQEEVERVRLQHYGG